MKIVYMGTPDFAVPPLAALVKAGYEITAVVTQPDKPKGRGKTLMPTPVKEEAMKHEIPVYQPVKVRDPEFVETLTSLWQLLDRSSRRQSWIYRNMDVSTSMLPCFRNTEVQHRSSRQSLTERKNPA